jgi:hypothetical protein
MATSQSEVKGNQTGNTLKVFTLEELKKLDPDPLGKIDPEKIKFGTDLQDSALIAQTFERGAHYTPKEVAVFATLNRHLENYRHISKNTSNMLKSYVMVPENSVSQQMEASIKASQDAGAEIPDAGTADPKDGQAFAQSLGMDSFEQSTGDSDNFGDKFSKWLSDCIPCDLRIGSWLELNPNIDLGNILRAGLSGMLDFLNGLGNLLRNLDVFGDFCALMDLFNFTCIPDLQRILLLLATLLAFEMPKIDGLIGLVQALIAPLFSPILTAIMGLFDQFILLVANPLECIVDAINQQLEKLPRSDNPFFPQKEVVTNPETGYREVKTTPGTVSGLAQTFGASDETFRSIVEKEEKAVALKEEWVDAPTQSAVESISAVSQGVGEGLSVLKGFISDTIAMLKEKLRFYLADLQSLLGDMASVDASYIAMSLRKMQIIRLISFITALITALASGNIGFCKGGGTAAEAHEIDNFYNNYLGPNNSFNVTVDEQGNLNFREKDDRLVEQHKKALPNRENVFEFEGKDLASQQIREVATVLSEPVQVTKPCRLEVTATEAETLNRYISELNEQ